MEILARPNNWPHDVRSCLALGKGVKSKTFVNNNIIVGLKKNLNVSRASEHPPVRGENIKTFS